MKSHFISGLLLALIALNGHAQSAPAPVVLDRVIAVINHDVLLQSDVDEEMHLATLEPFQHKDNDTRQNAMRRLINRDLILQQMNDQQVKSDISDAQVRQSLDEVRANLPACAKYDCRTAAGWKAFLAANDLTEQEVNDHWKQRLAVLHFIDVRFRMGIRIPQANIADYYAKSVVPVFSRQHQAPPSLKSVSGRIQEVLLQQQVNGMMQDWLKSLRDEGSVRIVDPEYAAAAETPSDQKQSEE
ncbi:MAG TPA: SurA N-terminal domain-containing protein [Silvibacterium sp.]|nr:SurA N-terminal domain-containing protein [Silvibacterium sp.]